MPSKSHRIPREARVKSNEFLKTQPSRLESAKLTDEMTRYRNNKMIENQNRGLLMQANHIIRRDYQLIHNFNKDSNTILNQMSEEAALPKPLTQRRRQLSYSNLKRNRPISEAKNNM